MMFKIMVLEISSILYIFNEKISRYISKVSYTMPLC